MKYRAQYEVLDQDAKVSELKNEARQRLIEDVLKLGMVTAGQASDPEIVEIDGVLWLEIEIEVRDAKQLIGAAK